MFKHPDIALIAARAEREELKAQALRELHARHDRAIIANRRLAINGKAR